MQKIGSLVHSGMNAFMLNQFGEEVEAVCDVHGGYVCRERLPGCPDCAKEAKAEAVRLEQLNRHTAILAERWKKSGMPEKFCGITLDDWVASSPEQKKVMQQVQAFAAGDVQRMLLMGNCGTGKTMLAAGVIGQMALQGGCNPIYTTATRLIRTIRDSWRSKDMSEQQAMDAFIAADVLVVDELGAGRCSEDDKLMLSEILCDRYAADMPTMLISNLNAITLKERVLDERAVDRMREGGVIISMKWQSHRVLGAAA